MAVDEVLLEATADAEIPTLRIYRWERPTLSLGYFQAFADRQSHPASAEVDVVRRQSGGGAILHDQEITYSLTIPGEHPLAANPETLYQTVHRGLVEWLNDFVPSEQQLRSEMWPGTQVVSRSEEPFLCFQRRSNGDVVLRDGANELGYKVIGSAQRRRRGAVLQHGSILWSTSQFAQEICGFANKTGCTNTLSEAQESLIESLPKLLSFDLQREELSADQQEYAHRLQQQRYTQASWTKRR